VPLVHVNNIFAKLGPPPDDADHRRVLAVLRFLSLGAGRRPRPRNVGCPR
jgi:hypothetical protein